MERNLRGLAHRTQKNQRADQGQQPRLSLEEQFPPDRFQPVKVQFPRH